VSALALMRDLQAAGVILEEREGRLRVDAPAGFLTPEVRDSLARHKPELLAMLAADPAEYANPAPLDDAAPWAADPAQQENWIKSPLNDNRCELPPLPDNDEHARWLRCEPCAAPPLPPTAGVEEPIEAQATPGPASSSSSDVASAVVTLTLRPHIERAGYHSERFDCYLGDTPIVTSRQPRHDAARELLARGFAPDTLLQVQHAGRAFDPTIVPKPIAELAEWTYVDSDRDGIRKVRWLPRDEHSDLPQQSSVGPLAAEDALAGVPVPGPAA
jgi:hypothetical protein